MSGRPALLPFLLVCIFLPSSVSDTAPRAQMLAARNASALTDLEQEVVREINLARTRPAEYAAYLEQMRANFVGKEYRQAGKVSIVTVEGVSALEEAINFLLSAQPVAPLEVSQGMCSGAQVLVTEQGATGATGHKGADGSFCEQRVERFGSWKAPIGENLSYGEDAARDRVIGLLVDDGVANRGHRQRIFDPGYKVIGVACGGHQLGAMCAITFAGGFTDKLNASQPQPANKVSAKPQTPTAARRF